MGFDSPLGDKKKNDEMSATKRHIRILLLLAAGLLAGCVREDPPTPETQEEIRLDASVWQMMQGAPSRRVSTYESATFPQNGESFRCFIYNANSTTSYNASEGSLVTWNSSTSKWEFNDGKHYWPASDALDFFAYMPTTVPSYITDMSDVASKVTYAARNPQFKCTLPVTPAGQEDLTEFVLALTTNQSKANPGATGVMMTFMHPFAKIKFQLSSATTDNVTVTSISMGGLVTSGSCSFDGTTSTWSNQSGSETMSISETLRRHATEGTPYLLMVPNEYEDSKNLSVTATWTEWGEVHTQTYSTPLTIEWVAGYSYTYNLTITRNELIVDVAKYTEQW